jgi:quinol monooxygenase YgiN
MAAALPFVDYSTCSEVIVPNSEWPSLYASLQALKAHVQEYPGCISFDLWSRAEPENVVVHGYTTWDTAEQLEAYLERGYSLLRYLAEVEGIAPTDHLVMEKIF